MKIQEILDKYQSYRDVYYSGNIDPYKEHKDYCNAVIDSYKGEGFPSEWEFYTTEYRYLRSKWKTKIKQNCIGFELSIAPNIWYVVIDEILIYISQECPYFEIEYIGLRNGGVKFCINGITDEIKDELELAEFNLWDKALLKW